MALSLPLPQVTLDPEENGDLDLCTFLARCTSLHTLTVEFDMLWCVLPEKCIINYWRHVQG